MPPILRPEQLALKEARRLKKLATQNASPVDKIPLDPRAAILRRNWARLRIPRSVSSSVKVMTWNMLAQTLVRRELFPSSDCLKVTQREQMLPNEIISYDPDIACLQEVDRLEKLVPALEKSGYECTYGSGPGKLHGCMILHKTTKFKKLTEHLVYLDEKDLVDRSSTTISSTPGYINDEKHFKGLTRRTKNIALLVALSEQEPSSKGYIAVTCHLFWHPRYVYERVRQGAIIRREILKFQKENNLLHWPVFFAGDFNCQPHEPLYSLLIGNPLTPKQTEDILSSKVIHVSVDPSIKPSSASTEKEDEEEDEAGGSAEINKEQPDPDRVFTNTRSALPEDGLMSVEEFEKIFTSLPPLRSAYDEGHEEIFGANDTSESVQDAERAFASRLDQVDKLQNFGRKGMNEPMYTSFTHYWRLTLDYIFIQDPLTLSPNTMPSPNTIPSPPTTTTTLTSLNEPALQKSERPKGEIIALLRTHRAEDLEPGLPKTLGLNTTSARQVNVPTIVVGGCVKTEYPESG